MQHNILITSAGKRVALTRYFKETLNRFYPDAKVFTTKDRGTGNRPELLIWRNWTFIMPC